MSLSDQIAAVVAAIGAELKLKADSADIPDALTDLDTTVTGAQLNDDHAKLAGIAAGAEINVNADWNANAGDAHILNKPTLGTAASHAVGDFATAAQGALADTGVQPEDLAPVATSGDYADLTGKPTLGTAAATNSTAYATAAQGTAADTAVQPGDLATVASSGAYTDLTGRPALAVVATTGSYADLAGTPALATQLTDLDTSVTGAQLDALAARDQSITATPTEINALHGAGVTQTELSYLDATSSIQAQIDGKQDALGFTPQDAASKGAANGYAGLDGAGKVPISQLPASLMEYKGTWNAATNTPVLADGIGDVGDSYRITAGAERDLGSGVTAWPVNGYAIYNGSTWEASGSAAEAGVTTLNGRSGDVVLGKADVGLASVDNTADASKAVASAAKLTTARTINGVAFDGTANITIADATKEPKITAGSAGQYWRGDKSWQTLDAAAVAGLGTAATTNASAYATAAQGTAADSAVQPGDLSAVATSGAYSDLTGTPSLAAVATSGSYSDLGGTPAIPDSLTDLDTTVTGTQLNALKSKVDGIAVGAEVNVQSDWNAASGDALILNKPSTFPPSAHTHTASQISDATALGRSLVTAASASAARSAIGAGTSSLTTGTTASTACAGNDARLSDARTPTAHTHLTSQVTGLDAALDGKVSGSGLTLWTGTAAQYAAISPKSATTVYVVT